MAINGETATGQIALSVPAPCSLSSRATRWYDVYSVVSRDITRILDLESDEPGISVDQDGRYVPDKSHLDAYFFLCRSDRRARRLYYWQIPEQYSWNATEGQWKWRSNKCSSIGRMANVDVRFRERFYLRRLLSHVRGARNYEELRQYRGIIYPTYAAACVARGLARDDSEWDQCIAEAIAWQMTPQLRRLFAMILAWNQPAEPHTLWEKYKDSLCEDTVRRHGFSLENAYTAALGDIAAHLAEYGKSLKDFRTLPQV